MESPYPTTSTRSAASFFYYTPDPQARPRHHGHFLPHPQSLAPTAQLLAPTPISPMSFPSQLVYGGNSNSLHSSRSLAPILSITPSASPSLQQHNVQKDASDMFFHPSTPPLSHSAVSTPSLTHALLTPMSNHGWSAEEPSCGTIAPFEMQLPSTPSDWAAESPEFASLYVFPTTTIQPPSIIVNDNYCPALSPSSSQASSATDLDFCDPRHLTFNTQVANDPEFGLEFPILSSLSSSNDEHCQLLGSSHDLVSIKNEEKSFKDFGLLFEDELDSEDDHWNISTMNMTESRPTSLKRQRVQAEFDYETNEDGFDFNREFAQSRHGSCSDVKSCQDHHSHSTKSDYSDSEEELTEAQRLRSFKFGSRDDGCTRSSKSSGASVNPSVIRRGRKQSLTEDPSKTFVCHLCNRRFRRQEHLKRHFRSLHTEDKPFSCGECGKKFSRSDNLTQHARIHGSGAILLGVLEENEVMDGHHRFSISHDEAQPLGIIVLDNAQASSGACMNESKSSEEKRNRRKRRKCEE